MLEIINTHSEITFLFFLGIIFIPRIMMLWIGAIQSGAVSPIAGFFVLPRIMICTLISASSEGSTSSGLFFLWIIWILSTILDIISILGFTFRGKLPRKMLLLIIFKYL